MTNRPISFYKNALDNVGKTITIGEAIEQIRSGKYEKQIAALRKVTDKNKNDDLKKKLPAVTWSGTFTKRSVKGLDTYSQVICIDIDKLAPDKLQEIKNALRTSSWVYCVFTSPNGNGLKVLYRTHLICTEHTRLFELLEARYKQNFSIQIDKSCKDVSRLCFLSSDPDLYFNEHSTLFPLIEATPVDAPITIGAESKIAPPVTRHPSPATTSAPDRFDVLRTFTDKVATYQDGNRNNYIYTFASNSNRRGYDMQDCLSYVLSTFTDYPAHEATPIVRNAYEKNAAEHGRFAADRISRSVAPDPVEAEDLTADIDDSTLFWSQYDDPKLKDKDGTPLKRVRYSFDNMIAFLANNGFFRYALEEDSSVLIRVRDNVVKVVDAENISDFVLNYLESQPAEFKMIRELFRQKIGTYMDIKQLKQLPILPWQIKKLDDQHTGYVYFRNNYLRITADGIETKPYSQLQGAIWARQRIDYDYSDPGDQLSVIADFFACAICGRNVTESSPLADDEKKKLLSLYTSIGYLIHRYKNPTLTKAVVASDKAIRDGNNSNGRSGKSLMGKILGRFINACMIEGKMFKFDAPRPFEKLNPDHALLNFNDVRKNFDFEGLFGLLTDDFTYNVIYKEAVTLSFDDSPKVFISTNFSLRGNGESMIGRQHIIEFSNYFTAQHQPTDEFKQMFFYDWSKPELQIEWALFYKFMISCLQRFLKHGLVDFPLENYGLNKLIDESDEMVVDWLEETIPPLVGTGQKNKKDMFEGFRTEMSHRKEIKVNSFTSWIKSYCTIKGYAINAHKKGDRDKSNGHEYWTFTIKQ